MILSLMNFTNYFRNKKNIIKSYDMYVFHYYSIKVILLKFFKYKKIYKPKVLFHIIIIFQTLKQIEIQTIIIIHNNSNQILQSRQFSPDFRQIHLNLLTLISQKIINPWGLNIAPSTTVVWTACHKTDCCSPNRGRRGKLYGSR